MKKEWREKAADAPSEEVGFCCSLGRILRGAKEIEGRGEGGGRITSVNVILRKKKPENPEHLCKRQPQIRSVVQHETSKQTETSRQTDRDGTDRKTEPPVPAPLPHTGRKPQKAGTVPDSGQGGSPQGGNCTVPVNRRVSASCQLTPPVYP